MKIATIGCDAQVIQIIQWLRRSSEYQIHAIVESGAHQQQLRDLVPNANFEKEWQYLIDSPDIDVVVMASRTDDVQQAQARTEQLKRIIDSPIPLIFVHPVCESIDAIECEMIRSDTNGILVPYLPQRTHSGFSCFVKHVASQQENIEQIVFERFAADRANSTVIDTFARDAVLLRELSGDLRNVSAMGGSREKPDYSNLAVNMTSKTERLVRWSMGPVDQLHGARITAVGKNGRCVLVLPDNSNSCQLEIDGVTQEFTQSDDEAIQSVFADFKRQMQREPDPSLWHSTCHALEVADCATQSCRRNRTIELLGEQPTEEDTFKAMMTAGGCGMMFWVLMLLPVDAFIPRDNTKLRVAWYCLFLLPLVVFLGLQFLKLLFKKK